VLRERDEIAELLQDSPSLRREVPGLLERRSDAAIKRAVSALALHIKRAVSAVALNFESMKAAAARRVAGYQPDEVLGGWISAGSSR
jgi:hypothetical protein